MMSVDERLSAVCWLFRFVLPDDLKKKHQDSTK